MKWKALPWVIAAGFVLRVLFALRAENIHHPDEIFQYLEQAHRLVFGNGLMPWEFRFGTRSWLVPLLIGVPLQATAWLGLDRPAVYIPAVKVIFCAISLVVIPLAYCGARRLASEAAGRIAAVVAAIWYELLYFSFRPLPDALSAYLLLGALVIVLGPVSRRRAALFGVVLALAVALRVQLLPLAGILALVAAVTWTNRCRVAAAATAAAVVVAAGALDRLTWGGWFTSYYNNYLFNAVYGVSGLFGEQGYRFFADQLIAASCGVFALAGVCALWWWRRLWLPLALIVVLVASHTLIWHKEYRFVFAAIPLIILIFGVVVALMTERLSAAGRRLVRAAALVGVAVVSIFGVWNRLPGQRAVYDYVPLFASDPSLQAYVQLSDDPSLKALFIADEDWWFSGGYYYLHRDVPIYFMRDVAVMRAESGLGVEAYASHVIQRGGAHETPGFEVFSHVGSAELRRNITGTPLRILAGYSRQVPEPTIDRTYTPRVRPFLPQPR